MIIRTYAFNISYFETHGFGFTYYKVDYVQRVTIQLNSE